MIQKIITWMYIRYVFLPELEKMRSGTNVWYTPQKVDQNWNRIEAAMIEKRFNTLH